MVNVITFQTLFHLGWLHLGLDYIKAFYNVFIKNENDLYFGPPAA